MKPRVLAVLAAAALLLLVPTAAQAKGATAATIDGGGPGGLPGGPITLSGDGEPGSSTDLGLLAQGSGLYTVVFGDDPGGVLKAAPTDRLGPRYTITWTFPDPEGGKDRKVLQHVYPYAAGGPVTFTPAGQPVLDTTTTAAWYQGFDGLRHQLIELGLPNRNPLTPAPKATPAPAPAPATPQPTPAAWPRIAAVVAGLLVLASGAALTLRRRSHPGATTAH
ncbi:MAG TPA: hypothetical protein VFU54_02725 [Actinomycetota bacterium]|nr:hypothetical protein [Actinomycetota bacterium]